MDLKQLEYFVTIVEEGNITAAANKLFMTQPPISSQIKLLEKELHCILFERGARTIHLTQAGETLYHYALSLLSLADTAKQKTIAVSASHTETLRIGIVSSLICSTALDWIRQFSLKYPHIRFEIIEGNTYELLQRFQSDSIHLAILRTPFNRERLTCKNIFSDHLLAIGDTQYFPESDNIIRLEDLSQMPLILYRRWEKIVRTLFSENHLEPNYFCINDDARTTLYFVDAGMGVGIVPASAITGYDNTHILSKEIMNATITSDVVLTYQTEARLPECAKRFIDYIDTFTKQK